MRRRSQLEERRRRVLREDATKPATPSRGKRSSDNSPGTAYASSALPQNQPRVTDFIPQRAFTLLILPLTGLTLLAGVIAADGAVHSLSRWFPSQALDGLRLEGRASIVSWLSSIVLALSALFALIIYSLRRHHVDDYRGRYRLWLWTAVGCTIGSIDTIVGVRHLFQTAMEHMIAGRLQIELRWWLLLTVTIFTILGIRVFIDMRKSIAARITFAVATSLYAIACLAMLDRIPKWEGPPRGTIQYGSLFAGHLLLLYTWLIFARNVTLEAQGKLPITEEPEKKTGLRGLSWILRKGKKSRSYVSNETLRDSRNTGNATKSATETSSHQKRANTILKPMKTAERERTRTAEVDSTSDHEVVHENAIAPQVTARANVNSGSKHREVDAKLMEMVNDPTLSKAERRRLRKKLRRQSVA